MKFIYLFKGEMPKEVNKDAMMKEWFDFTKKIQDSGKLLMGEPFGMDGKEIMGPDNKVIPDKMADMINGYMLVDVADMDEAVMMVKDAPHHKAGGSTIVRSCMMMDMKW